MALPDKNQVFYNLGRDDSLKIFRAFWPELQEFYEEFLHMEDLIADGMKIPNREIYARINELRRQIERIRYNFAGIQQNAYKTEYKNLEEMSYILDLIAYNIEIAYSNMTGLNVLLGFEILFVNESTTTIPYDEDNPVKLDITIILTNAQQYTETFNIERDIYAGDEWLMQLKLDRDKMGDFNYQYGSKVQYRLYKQLEDRTIVYCDKTLDYKTG